MEADAVLAGAADLQEEAVDQIPDHRIGSLLWGLTRLEREGEERGLG